jgi:hypothetical protein
MRFDEKERENLQKIEELELRVKKHKEKKGILKHQNS